MPFWFLRVGMNAFSGNQKKIDPDSEVCFQKASLQHPTAMLMEMCLNEPKPITTRIVYNKGLNQNT
jgi:hypothetical protein